MPIKFGRYELLERISVGGMAEVFKGRISGAAGFEKIIAIKRILPHLSDDQEFIAMFVDEAKLSAQLNHTNIGQVFEFGCIEERYFIAMEYIQGKDLRRIQDYFRSFSKSMPVPMALRVILEVCNALEYAHTKRDESERPLCVVHRDISPQNILLSYEGAVKLIDFGIAKALSRSSKTSTGSIKGKFSYMSPEQAEGEEVDARSDIFATGTVLYELITGQRLFCAETELGTLELVRNAEVAAPSTFNAAVSKQLDAIVLKALARRREERFQRAEELHEALDRFSQTARMTFGTKQLSRWMKSTFAAELEREESNLRTESEGLGPTLPPMASPASQPASSSLLGEPSAERAPKTTLPRPGLERGGAGAAGAHAGPGSGTPGRAGAGADPSPASQARALGLASPAAVREQSLGRAERPPAVTGNGPRPAGPGPGRAPARGVSVPRGAAPAGMVPVRREPIERSVPGARGPGAGPGRPDADQSKPSARRTVWGLGTGAIERPGASPLDAGNLTPPLTRTPAPASLQPVSTASAPDEDDDSDNQATRVSDATAELLAHGALRTGNGPQPVGRVEPPGKPARLESPARAPSGRPPGAASSPASLEPEPGLGQVGSAELADAAATVASPGRREPMLIRPAAPAARPSPVARAALAPKLAVGPGGDVDDGPTVIDTDAVLQLRSELWAQPGGGQSPGAERERPGAALAPAAPPQGPGGIPASAPAAPLPETPPAPKAARPPDADETTAPNATPDIGLGKAGGAGGAAPTSELSRSAMVLTSAGEPEVPPRARIATRPLTAARPLTGSPSGPAEAAGLRQRPVVPHLASRIKGAATERKDLFAPEPNAFESAASDPTPAEHLPPPSASEPASSPASTTWDPAPSGLQSEPTGDNEPTGDASFSDDDIPTTLAPTDTMERLLSSSAAAEDRGRSGAEWQEAAPERGGWAAPAPQSQAGWAAPDEQAQRGWQGQAERAQAGWAAPDEQAQRGWPGQSEQAQGGWPSPVDAADAEAEPIPRPKWMLPAFIAAGVLLLAGLGGLVFYLVAYSGRKVEPGQAVPDVTAQAVAKPSILAPKVGGPDLGGAPRPVVVKAKTAPIKPAGKVAVEKPSQAAGKKAAEKPSQAAGKKAAEKPSQAAGKKAAEKPSQPAGKKAAEKPATPTGKTGSLIVASKPPARIWVDGVDTGRSTPVPPASPLVLKAGAHKITLVAGSQRFTFQVTIKAGDTTRLIQTLSINR